MEELRQIVPCLQNRASFPRDSSSLSHRILGLSHVLLDAPSLSIRTVHRPHLRLIQKMESSVRRIPDDRNWPRLALSPSTTFASRRTVGRPVASSATRVQGPTASR